MREIGVEGKELNWYKTYLTNRTQTTIIKGEQSQVKFNDLGVPQGSVSGAKLFNLYINSAEKVIENSSTNMFADDAMIYLITDDIKRVKNK